MSQLPALSAHDLRENLELAIQCVNPESLKNPSFAPILSLLHSGQTLSPFDAPNHLNSFTELLCFLISSPRRDHTALARLMPYMSLTAAQFTDLFSITSLSA